MGIAERKQRQKEEVRSSILNAAWRLVESDGWQSLTMRKIADAIEYSAPVIYDHFANKEAILLEFIATFFLVFVVFGTAVDPKAPKVGGFAIGLTIAADILAIGPLTGGSMNPARSFGPAVASGIFEGQAVYWIGPILGGIAAALIYEALFIPHDVEPVEHGPARPVA